MNKIILIGRLTADPELKYTQSGKAVTKFTVAVDREFKNKDGEKETDFIKTITWGKLAEICSEYLDKGKKVAVDGRLQIRSYEQDGDRKWIAEVVANAVEFLSPAKGSKKEENKENGVPF